MANCTINTTTLRITLRCSFMLLVPFQHRDIKKNMLDLLRGHAILIWTQETSFPKVWWNRFSWWTTTTARRTTDNVWCPGVCVTCGIVEILLLRVCKPISVMVTPSISTKPSGSANRNKAAMRDDFPAPVLPTTPTCRADGSERVSTICVTEWLDERWRQR